jgi:hypothetical protein
MGDVMIEPERIAIHLDNAQLMICTIVLGALAWAGFPVLLAWVLAAI